MLELQLERSKNIKERKIIEVYVSLIKPFSKP